jgi:hypothetical protein
MQRFPAVMIGGPPDCGKSVLMYNLFRTLRERGVQHYALRAAPDGEGDWSNEAQQKLVRTILAPANGPATLSNTFARAWPGVTCRSWSMPGAGPNPGKRPSLATAPMRSY